MSAIAGRSNKTAWTTGQNAAMPVARPDALLVCSDSVRRGEYAQILERRGLRIRSADTCRAGITSTARDDVSMAVIIADRGDHYTGPLINSLWSRDRLPEIWLIGNPYALRLSEVIAGHNVAVLPPTTDAELFERVLDALDHSPRSAGGTGADNLSSLRERGRGRALHFASGHETRFDIPGLRDVFPRPSVEPL